MVMMGTRRRFRRRPRRIWLALFLIAGLALSRWGHDRWRGIPQPAREPPLAEGDYTVLRVVDGDTLLVAPQSSPPADRRREIRLRLLGIDCPESVKPDHPVEPWAHEAAEFTRQFVSGGAVRLRFDKRRLDRYDRYLAYVSVADKMLNEELVRAGLAKVSVFPGDSESMARRMRVAAEEARRAKRGVWSGQATGKPKPK
jgi:micrococcal nuclease